MAPAVVPFAVLTSAQGPMIPLVFVVSPAAEARKNGFAPTTPVPLTKVKVELAVRVRLPLRLTVAEPRPPLPGLARKTEEPPTKETLPRAMTPSVPLRLMNSNAPPSSWMPTEEAKRFDIPWMPVSSQRRRLLRTLIVSPAAMPEKRPWSVKETMLPMMVALPVN